MYSTIPSLVFGFHGCDREVGLETIKNYQYQLNASHNSYDWLGNGIYFWENSPERALAWAKKAQNSKISNGTVNEPFILGAVIDLGRCLNLTDIKHSNMLRLSYDLLKRVREENNEQLPVNSAYKRELDCEVINMIDYVTSANKLPKYDSVRAPYIEGDEVYPGASFREYTHIQICVRNPNCIKGYFHVRNPNEDFGIP